MPIWDVTLVPNVTGMSPEGFADALLAAPVGAVLLARLEASQRDDVPWYSSPSDSHPDAVLRALGALEEMPFGELLAAAVDAGNRLAGPWIPDAPTHLAHAYRVAPARRVLAQTIADRFDDELHGDAGLAGQQWWLCYDSANQWWTRPRFEHLDETYGSGEFTWNGLWTVTSPPDETHDELAGAWELWGNPVSRWALPVSPAARVWHIHRPADWVELVDAYPRPATTAYGWELPGQNQHRTDVQALMDIPGQRGVRASVLRHLVPDWPAVARDYDGVHLSWAGYLTTEGFIADLADGATTMLRYWFSERTLWLADVFGQPRPLGAPRLSGRVDSLVGIDVAHDTDRQAEDLRIIDAQLSR
jgi:hypothetical protein